MDDRERRQEELARGLNSALAGADERRASELERLRGLRRAKGKVLEREQARLKRKLGTGHTRVASAAGRQQANERLLRALAIETVRARTSPPRVNEQTWALYGHVRDADAKPLPNLTVALYTGDARWLRELGHACTDAAGQFRLEYGGTAEVGEAFVHVLDDKREHLYTAKRALRPRAGRADYREIILGGGARACAPPAPDSEEPPPRASA